MALAFLLSIVKLWPFVRSLAFGADLCGGLGVLPIVLVEVLTECTRSWDKNDVGLGVAVIMLPESCMGDSEDLFGVIVVSGVIMFLVDAAIYSWLNHHLHLFIHS